MNSQLFKLIVIHDNPRLLDLGGTLRAAVPTETFARSLCVAQQIGITRLANVTGLDVLGIPTWLAVRPLSKSLTVSQGKGITHELAKVSAIMESIELFHAEEYVPRGRYASIIDACNNPRDFIDPFSLPLNQHAKTSAQEKFEWTEANGYFSGRRFLIPRHLVCLDSASFRNSPMPFISSSNGLASGNTISEAVLHGVLETIERDQVSFWLASTMRSGSRSMTRVDPYTIDSSICLSLLDKVENAGLKIAIWYASTNLNIPVFCCTIFDDTSKTPYSQRASGFGCHIRKDIALSRAITEAAQSRLTHISGSRDDSGWLKYAEQLPSNSPLNKKWLAEILTEEALCDYSSIGELNLRNTANEWLTDIQEILNCKGLPEIVYINLTQTTHAISVCYISVPGLEFGANRDNYAPSHRMTKYLYESVANL